MIDEDKKWNNNCDSFITFITFMIVIVGLWSVTKNLHERSIILNKACKRQHNTESKN